MMVKFSKIKIFFKNQNFFQKSKCFSKIKILIKNQFFSKIEMLVKNQRFNLTHFRVEVVWQIQSQQFVWLLDLPNHQHTECLMVLNHDVQCRWSVSMRLQKSINFRQNGVFRRKSFEEIFKIFF